MGHKVPKPLKFNPTQAYLIWGCGGGGNYLEARRAVDGGLGGALQAEVADVEARGLGRQQVPHLAGRPLAVHLHQRQKHLHLRPVSEASGP